MSRNATVIICDTNSVLRFLLNDIPEQAQATEEAIREGAEITVEIVAECVCVLSKVYQLPRNVVAKSLADVMRNFICKRAKVVEYALSVFADTRLDFVDCILVAEAFVNDRQVLTFDKKLRTRLADACWR